MPAGELYKESFGNIEQNFSNLYLLNKLCNRYMTGVIGIFRNVIIVEGYEVYTIIPYRIMTIPVL